MIVSGILLIFITLLRGVIALFPTFSNYGEAPRGLINMLYIGFQFFPVDVFIFSFSTFIFWVATHFGYGIYRFIRRL